MLEMVAAFIGGLMTGAVVCSALLGARRKAVQRAATCGGGPEVGTTKSERLEPPTSAPASDVRGSGTRADLTSDSTHARVASAVLDVAEALTSAELRRRLSQALRGLDGVELVDPVPGTPFNPEHHVWDSTAELTEGARAETVASTEVVGLALADGTVSRRARVTVFG